MAIKPTYKAGLIISVQQQERDHAAAAGTYGLFADEGVVTTSANLTVAVAAIASGSYIINDTVETTAYAGGTVTSDAADGTNPRIDVVVINQSGTVSITKGTAAADPVPPDIGAGDLELAFLYLAQNDTAYASGDIFDRRHIIGQRKGRKSADVVAASTPVILADEFMDITGTTTITGLPARPAGWEVEFQFDAATPLTHNATSLILDGGQSRVVTAGDTARFRCLDGTNWKETVPQPGATRLDQAILNFVNTSRGGFYYYGGDQQALGAIVTLDKVGIGLDALVTGTGAFRSATAAEMPGGTELFVTAPLDDTGLFGGAASTGSFSPTDDWIIGAHVKQGASADGQEFFLGLMNSNTGFARGTQDIVGWVLEDTGNWIGVCDDGGIETTVDTSNNDTSAHDLRLEISGGGASVSFFFDDALVGSAVTTNITNDTTLWVAIGLTGIDTADHSFFFRDFYAFKGN